MDSITKIMDVIVHFSGSLGEHTFMVNKKLKEAGADPPDTDDVPHIDTANSYSKDSYMAVVSM